MFHIFVTKENVSLRKTLVTIVATEFNENLSQLDVIYCFVIISSYFNNINILYFCNYLQLMLNIVFP